MLGVGRQAGARLVAGILVANRSQNSFYLDQLIREEHYWTAIREQKDCSGTCSVLDDNIGQSSGNKWTAAGPVYHTPTILPHVAQQPFRYQNDPIKDPISIFD